MSTAFLDRGLPVPLYHQLRSILLADIESGKLQSGQQLPTEAKLAEQFGVSKITVRQALEELAQLGYIRREQGRGTFVSARKLGLGPRELTSFTEEMHNHHFVATSRVLEQAVKEADPHVAELLKLGIGDPVFVLKRLRMANGEPMGIQTAHIPAAMTPGIMEANFENASLYEVLNSRYGFDPARARETHFAILADQAAAGLLGIPAGSAVFAAERVTLLRGGAPFEFVTSIMRGDRYSIVLDLVKHSPPH